jgi:hypothetical protein
MATLTLAGIRNLIRSNLNVTATVLLTDTELNTIINDGYKDVCVKGFASEIKISKNVLTDKIISIAAESPTVIKINYVEYKSGDTEGGWGLLRCQPQTIGHNDASLINVTNGTGSPKYWFQWGNNLVIEPTPDVSTYHLSIYASCYPVSLITGDTGTLASLPLEFHECVMLFATAFAAIKLRKWTDFVTFYNRYISNVQQKRGEYINKYPEGRAAYQIPVDVSMVNPEARK